MSSNNEWQYATRSLRKALNEKSQMEALQYCHQLKLRRPKDLLLYHDSIQFVMAFPFSRINYMFAEKELAVITSIISKNLFKISWQNSFINSGLPNTEFRCQYSLAILHSLVEIFPSAITIFEKPENTVFYNRLLQAMVPSIEFYEAGRDSNRSMVKTKQLSHARTDSDTLQWVLDLFKQQSWSPFLKELLFDECRFFISWKPIDKKYSRSWLRCPLHNIGFRRDSIKANKVSYIIRQQIHKPLSLTLHETKELLHVIKISLALYARETDPFSFADVSETNLFEMGNGLQIASVGMNKPNRLSVESYIGFMAFRNGIPIAYGGGWLFGHRCKIGVNVYPAFRGAGSESLFFEIMRLYYQVYRARQFVVKPYQFGKGNPDGIKSAAFWFYYKMGFRPIDSSIDKVAANEWKKLKKDKTYRTSSTVLKYFTGCNLALIPGESALNLFNADILSEGITHMIHKKFLSDRSAAIIASRRILLQSTGISEKEIAPGNNEEVWNNWALLYLYLEGHNTWTTSQKKGFIRLIKLKSSGLEIAFILQFQKHAAFWKSLKLTHPHVAF